MRRLYVAGQGEQMTYCTAANFEAAKMVLGDACRHPDPDDVRMVWKLAKMDAMSCAEVKERFGVSRQTVDGWWRKAGGGLTRRREHLEQDRTTRLRSALLKAKGASATSVARAAKVSVQEVKRMAEQLNVSLTPWHRRPSDDELVEVAKGKTWPEFAAALGLRVSTLRAYIYARPELSARIREVRISRRTGTASPNRVDPLKVKRLHKKGLSAYAISLKLGVEQMAVRYWIQKLALGGEHDPKARDGRKAGAAVGSSDGGTELQS